MTTIKVEILNPFSNIKYQCCKENIASYKLTIGLSKEYLCDNCLDKLTKELNDISADSWLDEETN